MLKRSGELFCFDLILSLFDSLMGEPKNPRFYDVRILNVSMTPKTNYFYLLRPQYTLKKSRNIPDHVWKSVVFRNLIFWQSNILKMLEMTGTDRSRRSVSWILENLGYEIKIFQKTWSGSLVNLRNFETTKLRNLKPRNQETLKLWNQETLKPRNEEPPQHTDPTAASDHPLWGHERTWGTRVVGGYAPAAGPF